METDGERKAKEELEKGAAQEWDTFFFSEGEAQRGSGLQASPHHTITPRPRPCGIGQEDLQLGL